MTYSISFAYEVAPQTRAEFEAVYGPDGEWAQFFRTGAGYVETTLERTGESDYLVTDHWRSRADYESFLARHAARYEAMSKANSRLYLTERRLT
jgi:heme-degrading monooxygenase HmoA